MQRLHRERDIKRVFREGRRFHSPVAVLHARRRSGEEGTLPGPRLTVIAGRSFRTAIARNRGRRVLREVSRVLLKDTQVPCDLLVVARYDALSQPYQARLQTLTDLFSRADILPKEGGDAEEGGHPDEGGQPKEDGHPKMSTGCSAPTPGLTARAAIVMVRFYQRFLSCLKPPTCRFYPTCSEYGLQAITNLGLMRGGLLAAWRLLRCNPLSAGGYDPGPWAKDVTHGQSDTAESLPRRRGSEGRA